MISLRQGYGGKAPIVSQCGASITRIAAEPKATIAIPVTLLKTVYDQTAKTKMQGTRANVPCIHFFLNSGFADQSRLNRRRLRLLL